MKSFSDMLHYEAREVPRCWIHYLYNTLTKLPTLCKGHTSDLKLEAEFSGIQFRYWVSRLKLQDRPQGEYGGYVGGWPRIEIEACYNNRWITVDGYQGNTV